jgi:magnesium chelatase subunit I
MMNIDKIKTLGELKKSGYKHRSVKEEVRENLLKRLNRKENSFPGIVGYEDSVVPDTERALLSRHNILFLGLRGQAKTRMARQMINLLDEYIPYVTGSEINDDPFAPISKFSRELIRKNGDETPISWLNRNDRYSEKLATPDVSVADLIGDIDPIKAANMRLNFADEEVIHFGIIPKSNRGIFVINEIPDLQARIQVSLFNILEEGDIQIRGFKLHATGYIVRVHCQPGRLYQPRVHRYPVKRSHRKPDPDTLPKKYRSRAVDNTTGSGHHGRSESAGESK